MNLKKFFSELKRREVYKVAIAYGITAWLLAQISGLISTSFEFPSWVMQMIISILIIGFPIALILSWVFEFSSKGIRKTKPAKSDGADENKTMETRLVIGVLVLIGLLMMGGWWTWQKFGFDKNPPIKSLVVLPFDNFTGNDESEYFVAGMHSSLIQDIGRISALKVKSKTTANSFKETDLSIPEIASELGIDAAVEGSITCMGEDSICVQIRLIKAFPEEQQLWVQDYRIEKSQILNFYNKVTKQISKEIDIILTPQEESLLVESRMVDKKSYDAYLQGRYYWGSDISEESLNKALEYLKIAIESDPDWAPPYSGLAQVWVGLAQMGFVSPEIAGPKIYENINKALELDPNFSDSHYINALIAVWTEWDWEKGEKEFLFALSINPNDAMSRIYYAHLLVLLQRTDEALSQGNRAIDLDPLNPLIQALYAVVLADAGNWRSAFEYCEKSLVLDPGSFFASSTMEYAAYNLERYDEAIKALKVILPLENDAITDIENIYNELGYDAALEEVVHQMKILSQTNFVPPMDMAGRLYMLNRNEEVMDWIEKGFEIHDPNIPYIASGLAGFIELYDNPRFIEILQKINLPPSDKQ